MHVTAIISPMAVLSLIVALRFIVRRQAIAVVIVWLLFGFLGGSSTGPVWMRIVFTSLSIGVLLAVLLRFGLLAGIACNFVIVMLGNAFVPVTPLSLWYAPMEWLGLLYLAGLAVYGFWTSLGGRPLAGKSAKTA
jgi:hypothetical protein